MPRFPFFPPHYLPFPLEDRVPPTEQEKQTSHQIFLLHISAKSEYFKLAAIKGTSSGAGPASIFRTHSLVRTHSLARLSVQSQPLLSHPSEFGSSPPGAG